MIKNNCKQINILKRSVLTKKNIDEAINANNNLFINYDNRSNYLKLYNIAFIYFHNKNYIQAIIECKNSLKLYLSKEAYYLLTYSFLYKNFCKKALEIIKIACSKYPEDLSLNYFLAELHLKYNNNIVINLKICSELIDALQKDNRYKYYLYYILIERGNLYNKMEKYDFALIDYINAKNIFSFELDIFIKIENIYKKDNKKYENELNILNKEIESLNTINYDFIDKFFKISSDTLIYMHYCRKNNLNDLYSSVEKTFNLVRHCNFDELYELYKEKINKQNVKPIDDIDATKGTSSNDLKLKSDEYFLVKIINLNNLGIFNLIEEDLNKNLSKIYILDNFYFEYCTYLAGFEFHLRMFYDKYICKIKNDKIELEKILISFTKHLKLTHEEVNILNIAKKSLNNFKHYKYKNIEAEKIYDMSNFYLGYDLLIKIILKKDFKF